MSWQLTNRSVSDISRRSRHSIFSFVREFITRFKSIQAKQVELESSSLARSLRDLIHWSSLRSLLRSCERSTCRNSINAAIPTFVCMLLYNFVSVLIDDWDLEIRGRVRLGGRELTLKFFFSYSLKKKPGQLHCTFSTRKDSKFISMEGG